MAKKEKKQDMRNGMWERGPAEDLNGGREEALQQARENIDADNPRIVRRIPVSKLRARRQATNGSQT